VIIPQIKQSLKLDDKKLLKIETGYTGQQLIGPILKIASIAGTEAIAKEIVERIKNLLADSKAKVEKAGLKGKPVICHFFYKGFAEEMGLNPVATIGPAPLELFNLGELVKKEAVLIIDNAHNPVAQPLTEIKKGVRIVECINFPGSGNTNSLEEVINYNVSKIIDRE